MASILILPEPGLGNSPKNYILEPHFRPNPVPFRPARSPLVLDPRPAQPGLLRVLRS